MCVHVDDAHALCAPRHYTRPRIPRTAYAHLSFARTRQVWTRVQISRDVVGPSTGSALFNVPTTSCIINFHFPLRSWRHPRPSLPRSMMMARFWMQPLCAPEHRGRCDGAQMCTEMSASHLDFGISGYCTKASIFPHFDIRSRQDLAKTLSPQPQFLLIS